MTKTLSLSFQIVFFIPLCITIIKPVATSTEITDKGNCKPGWTGSSCNIPFEACADGDRRCFNNSKCVKHVNDQNLSSSDEDLFVYSCDCSYASSISSFAGTECEHAATMYCDKGLFCTNGGQCLSHVHRGTRYEGCDCHEEYMGAHCQFLKAEMHGDMPGETAVPEISPNFYIKDDPTHFDVEHDDYYGDTVDSGTDVSLIGPLIVIIIFFSFVFAVCIPSVVKFDETKFDLVDVTEDMLEKEEHQRSNNAAHLEVATGEIS